MRNDEKIYKTVYCPICGKEHEVEVKTRIQTAVIKDEIVNYEEEYYVCNNVKSKENEFAPAKLFDQNLLRARDEYRKNKNLLTSIEMKNIRKKYNLNQAEFSLILGWGEITLTRYETKQIQEYSHDKILKNARDNALFVLDCFYENKEKLLNKVSKERCLEIEESIKNNVADYTLYFLNEQEILAKYSKYNSSLENGYKEIALNKLEAIVNYISNKVDRLYKVRLMKILWYCDFYYFKKYKESITGLVYLHKPMGALPVAHNEIIKLKTIIPINEEFESEDGTITEGVHIIPNNKNLNEKLSIKERKCVDEVLEKISKLSTRELVEKMHNEEAYIKTNDGDVISYEYAKNLK